MMVRIQKFKRILLTFIWLALTCSLGVWWFYLGLENVERLIELRRQIGGASLDADVLIYQRQAYMIVTEGLFFLSLLVIGGVGMLVLAYQDISRNHLMQEFFSTVTHEMKTPLASLQLQIESLLEDVVDRPVIGRLEKVLKENQRIERQMNKAFYLASLMRGERLFIEDDVLDPILRRLQMDWPELQCLHAPGIKLRADMRALESILKNIIENAVQHGGADKIVLSAGTDNGNVWLKVHDNGRGFDGDPARLGQAFVRHSATSGTGIGIYIIKRLTQEMYGRISFSNNPDAKGFQVKIELPGGGRK